MSSSMSVGSVSTSSQSDTPDPSAILQLEKLEKAIGDQLKAATVAAQKNPNDPAAQLLVAQLSTEFSMVQTSITELTGAVSSRSGQSSIKAAQAQLLKQSDQARTTKTDAQKKTTQQASERTAQSKSNRLRLDGTGIYVNEAV